jgi:hypothetical protein
MASSTQTVNLNLVFDYELFAGDPTSATARAVVGEEVRAILLTDGAVNTAAGTIVNLVPREVVTTTDANGYWELHLVPASLLSPAAYWLITTPTRTLRITGQAGQASQTTA